MNLNAQTKVADIIETYPFMKAGMADINAQFKMLQTPMGAMMMRRVTIADMSEHSGVPVDELVAAITQRIGDEACAAADSGPAVTAEPVSDAPAGDVSHSEQPPAETLPAWWKSAEDFPVVDVRGAHGNFFPGLKKRAEAVAVGEGMTVVQSFEPLPLYDVMEALGFERVTRRPAEGEYRVYFYRATEGAGPEGIVFRPVALLNFPLIDDDLADLAVEFWDLTWNDERRYLPQTTRLLLSMAHALGAGRMRQASRELIKTYALGCESAALDDVLELIAWNSGIGTFASEIGPSTFFRAYRIIKEQEAKGTPRAQIVSMLTERFGEKNPDVGVQ